MAGAVAAVARPFAAEAGRAWRVGGTPVRAAAVVGAALMVVGLVHGLAFLVLGGAWVGPVAWRKPFAFGLSFGLTTATVAWVVTRLRVAPRLAAVLLGALAVASTFEVAWVTIQRARGVASHFNDDTSVDELAFTVAGGGSVAVIALVLTWVTVLSWVRAAAPPALVTSIRSGLSILLVSQAIGGWMIQRGVASLGEVGSAPASHAITPTGDLKVAHAVAMHAIQVLPVLALLLLAGDRPTAARGGVRLAAGAYSLLAAAALLQAVSGRALTDPAPLALAAAAPALAVLVVVAAQAVMRTAHHRVDAPVA